MLSLRVMVSFYSKHCGSWKSRKNREFPDNREDKYLLDPTEKVCFKELLKYAEIRLVSTQRESFSKFLFSKPKSLVKHNMTFLTSF